MTEEELNLAIFNLVAKDLAHSMTVRFRFGKHDAPFV